MRKEKAEKRKEVAKAKAVAKPGARKRRRGGAEQPLADVAGCIDDFDAAGIVRQE